MAYSLLAERLAIRNQYTLSRKPQILQVEALKLFYSTAKYLAIGKILTMKL